ncbi:MAG TPA: hypothetical protein VFA96_08520 [Nocardioides sp.]|nr:hypothetical protein [Nocardioides sp.]
MDKSVLTYLLYLLIAAPLTIWVGSALRHHGEVFLIDVFRGDESLARAVNRLLVIGFYLLNFGYVSLYMASTKQITTGREVMEQLSTKLGAVAMVLGVIHFGNVWALNAFRRRAVLRAQGLPPVAPNDMTRVAARAR